MSLFLENAARKRAKYRDLNNQCKHREMHIVQNALVELPMWIQTCGQTKGRCNMATCPKMKQSCQV